MKIRLDEKILRLGDYSIVRVDDYNLELQNKNGELIGHYGFMCHAVKQAFLLTINDVRKQGVFTDVLGDEKDVAGCAKELFNDVPLNAVFDFSSQAKEQLAKERQQESLDPELWGV
tara:strand:- start:122 stop:469 length:348 start_codon:yes stop_codon:yes gene_type:complete